MVEIKATGKTLRMSPRVLGTDAGQMESFAWSATLCAASAV
jgi:hypothetical protein